MNILKRSILTGGLVLAVAGITLAQPPIVGPSINISPNLQSVRAHQMKGEARDVRDASRKNAPPPRQQTQTNSTTNRPTGKARASSVHRSAADGRAESVSAAVDKNPHVVRSKDSSGYTPLHHAAIGGHSDVVEVLLEKGAQINMTGGRGETALYLAASKGNAAVVELLATNGADVNRASSDGKTPLHKAAMAGHADTVITLLEAGADPAATDRSRRTPLQMAERYRAGDYDRIIRALKEASE